MQINMYCTRHRSYADTNALSECSEVTFGQSAYSRTVDPVETVYVHLNSEGTGKKRNRHTYIQRERAREGERERKRKN